MAAADASIQRGHACHQCGKVPARHMMVVPNTQENYENAKACQMSHWNIAHDPENPHVLEVPLCFDCRNTFKEAYQTGKEEEDAANAARIEEDEVREALRNSLCDLYREEREEARQQKEEEELRLAIQLSLTESRGQAAEDPPPQQQASEPTSSTSGSW